ncbi:MAG: type II toxin-antitoxin system HicA family toxin [Acetobacteraceae bacterium]|nr:type II toxin-antitoxin system HicA family toxin [Acetobacteraceae bacterium]
MKARDLIKLLQDDGWTQVRTKGSHIQFRHPTKAGLVTVPFHGGNADIMPPLLTSILRQAGIKRR